MSSKKLRIILIIFIILNIIASFIIIRVIKLDDKKQNTIQIKGSSIMSNGAQREGFKNVEVLYRNYRGEIPKVEIASRVERIALQYFPIIKNQLEDEDISVYNYFENNKASIKNRFGITEEEKFKTLVERIKEINCNIEDCKSYQVLEDSFTNDGIYTKCTLVYTYSNNQEIKLDLYINNSSSSSELEYKINP